MRTSTSVLVEPRVEPEAITTLSPEAAREKLWEFAQTNGHERLAFDRAIAKLKEAVMAAGTRVDVHHAGAVTTRSMHDCLEDIVRPGSISHDLAVVATDAVPGTHFKTEIRRDHCQTWVVSTNAPR